jgi:uncharacterized membrane protein YbaN (DUF454 family)
MTLLEDVQRAGAKIGAYRNVAWLLAALTGLGALILGFSMKLGLAAVVVVVGALATLGMMITALVLYRRSVAPVYRWLSAEYIYKFAADDLRRQTQIIKIRIRANRDNVTIFHNSYYRTGVGESEIRIVGSSGHKVCQAQAKGSGRRNYYVHLQQPLGRNQETVIHLEQSLFDEDRKFMPILAKRVSEPVDKLTLRVVFPLEAQPTTITKALQCRQSNSDPEHWITVKHDEAEWNRDDRSAEVAYYPSTPKLGYRYELEWEPWDIYRNTGRN